MNKDEFRASLSRAGLTRKQFAHISGFHPDYVGDLGRRPVARHVKALVEAIYLLDGPKRQELLKAIER